MPRLLSKPELASLSESTAINFGIIEYRDHLYLPVDYLTGQSQPSDPTRTIWRRMQAKDFRRFANETLDILFANEGEYSSFLYMTQQLADKEEPTERLLIMTADGVKTLDDYGKLVPSTGRFSPYYVNLFYDDSVDEKPFWDMIVGWVDGEEQARAVLRHLSVGLQPNWTASKYLLFIGSGLNGKSTLLRMIEKIIGQDNVSGVHRQEMSAKRPTVTQLNGSLMNIILDGPKDFIKDSSSEKTLVAGERLDLEMKYSNVPVSVMSNALFLEGLNDEPKTSDKSPALQRRLVRFYFPNTYKKDIPLEDRLLSPQGLSALLKLILQNWVHKSEASELLANTEKSQQLQLEHQWSTSPFMQFMEHMASVDVEELKALVCPGALVDRLVHAFRSWSDSVGLKQTEEGYTRKTLEEYFITTRKTVRLNGKPSTRRVITEARPTTLALLAILLKEEDVVRGE